MSNEKKQSFMGGVTVLAISTILVKICGALYKIPLGNILGDEGIAHFNTAYNIYSVLLTISTAGLPLALSKLVSEANSLGRTNQARRCFRTAMGLFLVIGVLGTAGMLLFTGELAAWMNNSQAYWPIKMLGISFVCVSIMCAFRGYAQGRQNMVPTAVSQLIESFFKLVVGLPLAWYLIKRGFGLDIGAAGAIVGVTAGIILAMLFMIFDYFRHRNDLPAGSDMPEGRGTVLKRLLQLGIPITIGQAGMSILNMLDQKIIMGQLQNLTRSQIASGQLAAMTEMEIEKASSALYGQYTLSSNLYNLLPAFLPAVAISLIPAISVAATRQDHREVNRVVSASFRLIAVIAIPAGVGLSVMAGPILQLLYPSQAEAATAATYHLQLLGIASIFMCVMLLTNSIMQAHNKVNWPIYTMLIGGVVKVAVNYVLVGDPDINIKGAPIGTLVCYGLIAVLNLILVYRLLADKPNYFAYFCKPVLASVVMGAACWACYGLTGSLFGAGYLRQALATMVSIGVAVVVYLVLVIALRIITREDLAMVPKGDKIARLLHIR